eukprot:s4127_g3.t1
MSKLWLEEHFEHWKSGFTEAMAKPKGRLACRFLFFCYCAVAGNKPHCMHLRVREVSSSGWAVSNQWTSATSTCGHVTVWFTLRLKQCKADASKGMLGVMQIGPWAESFDFRGKPETSCDGV